MENEVTFNESKLTDEERAAILEKPLPTMIRGVIRYSGGLISEPKLAQQFLLAIAALILLISLMSLSRNWKRADMSAIRQPMEKSENFVE